MGSKWDAIKSDDDEIIKLPVDESDLADAVWWVQNRDHVQ